MYNATRPIALKTNNAWQRKTSSKTQKNKAPSHPTAKLMALITSSPSPSISTSILTNNNITIEIDCKKGEKYLVDNSKDMKMLPSQFVLPIPEGERPSLAIDGSIPDIDMSGLNGPDEQRLSTIHAISSACAQWGFFRVT